ncbi:hypothetical protein SRHO_G00261160 [Serrasalmus rhombeus]
MNYTNASHVLQFAPKTEKPRQRLTEGDKIKTFRIDAVTRPRDWSPGGTISHSWVLLPLTVVIAWMLRSYPQC